MRVLIVEDNPATRDTLTRGLSEELFQVEAVATASEAEALTQDTTFDVIVLDVMLPDLDGITVCRRLRARGVDTPILLLTGWQIISPHSSLVFIMFTNLPPRPYALTVQGASQATSLHQNALIPA